MARNNHFSSCCGWTSETRTLCIDRWYTLGVWLGLGESSICSLLPSKTRWSLHCNVSEKWNNMDAKYCLYSSHRWTSIRCGSRSLFRAESTPRNRWWIQSAVDATTRCDQNTFALRSSAIQLVSQIHMRDQKSQRRVRIVFRLLQYVAWSTKTSIRSILWVFHARTFTFQRLFWSTSVRMAATPSAQRVLDILRRNANWSSICCSSGCFCQTVFIPESSHRSLSLLL